ncbi:unnamed protein product [Tetraodon nigroviridis]|uniref:Synaptogyrin n=1 Tax=Tetraodon nigroviridis TaxID=99883 RepID=Q4S014_TETNG|nr:unnamed protein product [Tetraodon nigroviridis]
MQKTDGASEFGASLVGGFDIHKFVRQPRTIVRVLSWLFSMVVFACITTEGHVNSPWSSETHCIFNQNDVPCPYALSVGVIGFLACVVFLFLDVYLPFVHNEQQRKVAVVADLGFSGVWAFLWFVCFCLLTNQWSHTQDTRGIPADAARATVAFSFFSIATWAILTYFAVCRFRRGDHGAAVPTYTEAPPDLHTPYPPTYAPTTYTPTVYAAYPSGVSDTHQQPPYTSAPQPQGDPGYHTPSY